MIPVLLALATLANPRPFPFSYTYPTVPAGHLEIEQYVDVVPVQISRAKDGTVDELVRPRFKLQTELELGITDRLEFGFYLVFTQGGGDQPMQFDGVKQRIRYRLFEAGELPIDIALYGEIGELIDEIELEQKIILSRRFGPMQVALNLWFEQEYKLDDDEFELIYNPTLGASLELSPHVSLGVEGWMRGKFEANADANVFVGPVLLAQLGEYWASFGGYLELTDLGDPLTVGDKYGPLYLRLILGIGL